MHQHIYLNTQSCYEGILGLLHCNINSVTDYFVIYSTDKDLKIR